MTGRLLSRARGGDERAFGELVGPYRRELHVHCYRMLGSVTDAEDVLQETLLAAWTGLAGFAGRASIRAWLYRIATNRCLNARRDARRVPTPAVPPFEPPEPSRRSELSWLQPYPDVLLADGPEGRYQVKESVRLAFIVGLQRLPPRQTAVLVLRDVLGFSTAEVAEMLDTTGTAVKGALQRARATLDTVAPAPAAGSPQEQDLVRRFADAFTDRDLDALIGLLTDDAWLAMPPAPHEYHGPAAIASFLQVSWAWWEPHRMLLSPTRANGQPAFACYLADLKPANPKPTDPPADLKPADREPADPRRADPKRADLKPAGLMVLTLRGDRISGLTRFLDSVALARSGLI